LGVETESTSWVGRLSGTLPWVSAPGSLPGHLFYIEISPRRVITVSSEDEKEQRKAETVRERLLRIATEMESLQSELEESVSALTNPKFAPETDDPLNLEAAWQGTVQAILEDELRPACAALRRAAAWTDDSASWRLRS
jgi:hypothetical protein